MQSLQIFAMFENQVQQLWVALVDSIPFISFFVILLFFFNHQMTSLGVIYVKAPEDDDDDNDINYVELLRSTWIQNLVQTFRNAVGNIEAPDFTRLKAASQFFSER